MAHLEIRMRGQVDEGTKEFSPIGPDSGDVTGDLEGSTGEAESTLVREATATEHEGKPTGEAKKQGEQTVTAEWPQAKEVKAPENKQVKSTTTKTTAKKTTRRKKS